MGVRGERSVSLWPDWHCPGCTRWAHARRDFRSQKPKLFISLCKQHCTKSRCPHCSRYFHKSILAVASPPQTHKWQQHPPQGWAPSRHTSARPGSSPAASWALGHHYCPHLPAPSLTHVHYYLASIAYYLKCI
ncbi:hypothetical protein XENTR_v10006431 [Xenopus tropicalis]|nr:hypothetical protein XENTR_v10006431 [Xenopus tropicalis]